MKRSKQGKTLVTRVVPALTARTQFGQILRRVRQNRERFVVDRRGEPQAVILSVEEYLQLFVKPSRTLEAVQAEAKALGLNSLSLKEINREIRAYRRERHRTHAQSRP